MLSQSVASELREAISAGEFQPGEQLSEVKAELRQLQAKLASLATVVQVLKNSGLEHARPT